MASPVASPAGSLTAVTQSDMARSALRTVDPCHVSEMASPVPSPAGSLTAVTQSDMARSARRRVGPRHGERPLRLARWRGRRLGGRPRVRRPRLRALVPTGRPRAQGEALPYKAMWAARRRGRRRGRRARGARRVEMASPRGQWWHRVLGAVTGDRGLFWGDTCRIGEGRRPERA